MLLSKHEKLLYFPRNKYSAFEIKELINKAQDKWIFLYTKLWKKLFRLTFSNVSLVILPQFSHSLDEAGELCTATCIAIPSQSQEHKWADFSIYRLNYDIFILRLYSIKHKRILLFRSIFLSIHYRNVASTATEDMINQRNAESSASDKLMEGSEMFRGEFLISSRLFMIFVLNFVLGAHF